MAPNLDDISMAELEAMAQTPVDGGVDAPSDAEAPGADEISMAELEMMAGVAPTSLPDVSMGETLGHWWQAAQRGWSQGQANLATTASTVPLVSKMLERMPSPYAEGGEGVLGKMTALGYGLSTGGFGAYAYGAVAGGPEAVARHTAGAQEHPTSVGAQAFQAAGQGGTAQEQLKRMWEMAKSDPATAAAIVPEIALESMTMSGPSMVPGYVGGALAGKFLGPKAAYGVQAPLVGGASFAQEFGGKIIEEMPESGYDPTNADDVRRALTDQAFRERVLGSAAAKASRIAIFDSLSAGVGRLLGSQAVSKVVADKALRALAVASFGVAVEAIMDAAGEYLGQMAAGEDTDMSAVLAEVMAGIPQTAADIGMGAFDVMAGGDNQAMRQTIQAVSEMRGEIERQAEALRGKVERTAEEDRRLQELEAASAGLAAKAEAMRTASAQDARRVFVQNPEGPGVDREGQPVDPYAITEAEEEGFLAGEPEPAPEPVEGVAQGEAAEGATTMEDLRRRIRDTFERRGQKAPEIGELESIEREDEGARAAVALGRVLGLQVRFIRPVDQGGAGLPFNGTLIRETGEVFIRSDSENPAVAVLLHEAGHEMETSSPGAYRAYLDVVRESLREGALAEYAERLDPSMMAGLDDEALMREVAADALVLGAERAGFWQELADKAPESLRALVEALGRVAERISEAIGRVHEAHEVASLMRSRQAIERVREAAQAALEERVGVERGPTVSDMSAEQRLAALERRIGDVAGEPASEARDRRIAELEREAEGLRRAAEQVKMDPGQLDRAAAQMATEATEGAEGDAEFQARGERLAGAEAVAQRIARAHAAFYEDAMEQFGLSREEARLALEAYKRVKLVKLDPVMGRFKLKVGQAWEGRTLRNAARDEAQRAGGEGLATENTEGAEGVEFQSAGGDFPSMGNVDIDRLAWDVKEAISKELPYGTQYDLRIRFGEGSGSAYFTLPTGESVRLSNHPRLTSHLAAQIHAESDISILVLTPEDAREYQAWLADSPRGVYESIVVERRPGQRYATTAKAVKDAIDQERERVQREYERDNDPAVIAEREARDRAAREQRAREEGVRDAVGARRSIVQQEWVGEGPDLTDLSTQMPPVDTPGRAEVRRRLTQAAIERGAIPAEIEEAGLAGWGTLKKPERLALARNWLDRYQRGPGSVGHPERREIEGRIRRLIASNDLSAWDAIGRLVLAEVDRRMESAGSIQGGRVGTQERPPVDGDALPGTIRQGEDSAEAGGDVKGNLKFQARDAAHREAVERGDTEAAQAMVDEAAKAAGYNVGPVWHFGGSDIQVFDVARQDPNARLGRGFYFMVHPRGPAAALEMLARTTGKFEDALWEGGPSYLDYLREKNMVVSAYLRNAVLDLDQFGIGEAFVTDPADVKSADAATYDDAGNVIPLSERFQAEEPDIRFQAREMREAGQKSAATVQAHRNDGLDPGVEDLFDAPETVAPARRPAGEQGDLFARGEGARQMRASLADQHERDRAQVDADRTEEPGQLDLLEDLDFQAIGRKRREAARAALVKKRPDLDAEAVLAALDAYDDPKAQKLALHWTLKGTVIPSEDQQKVARAIQVAEDKGVDPMRYDGPVQILEAFKGQVKAEPVDPASIEWFTDRRELGEGVTVWTIESEFDEADAPERQAAARKIMDTHWGEDANPWCLLYKEPHGTLERAFTFWQGYSRTEKKMAFQDGRLLAFYADGEWWDRLERSGKGIPIAQKIPGDRLKRKQLVRMDEATGEVGEAETIYKGDPNDGLYVEWFAEKPEQVALRERRRGGELHGAQERWRTNGQIVDRVNWKDGKQHGLSEGWYDNGQRARRSNWREGNLDGLSESWYETGQLQRRATYRRGVEHGLSEAWHRNGQIKERENRKDGKLDGVAVSWYANGQIKKRENRKDGKLDGVAVSWYANGQIKGRYNWKDGERDGLRESWYENGQMMERSTYKDGNLDGLREMWHKNGQRQRRATYRRGVEHGLSEAWHRNGQITARSNWREGNLDGLSESWYETGQLQRRATYRHGAQHGLSEWWYENGQMMERSTYKDGNLDGLREHWYENGQMMERSTYKDGKLDGLRESWYENGQMMVRENHKDGKLDGLREMWHKNGQRQRRATYRDNRMVGPLEEWDENGRGGLPFQAADRVAGRPDPDEVFMGEGGEQMDLFTWPAEIREHVERVRAEAAELPRQTPVGQGLMARIRAMHRRRIPALFETLGIEGEAQASLVRELSEGRTTDWQEMTSEEMRGLFNVLKEKGRAVQQAAIFPETTRFVVEVRGLDQIEDPVLRREVADIDRVQRRLRHRWLERGKPLKINSILDIDLALAQIQERTGIPVFDYQSTEVDPAVRDVEYMVERDIDALFDGLDLSAEDVAGNQELQTRVVARIEGDLSVDLSADEETLAQRVVELFAYWEPFVKYHRHRHWMRTGEAPPNVELGTLVEGRSILVKEGREAYREWLDQQNFGIRQNYFPHETRPGAGPHIGPRETPVRQFGSGHLKTRDPGRSVPRPLIGGIHGYLMQARRLRDLQPRLEMLAGMLQESGLAEEEGNRLTMINRYFDALMGKREENDAITSAIYFGQRWFWRTKMVARLADWFIRNKFQPMVFGLPKTFSPFDPIWWKNVARLGPWAPTGEVGITQRWREMAKDPEAAEFFHRYVSGKRALKRHILLQEHLDGPEGDPSGFLGRLIRLFDKAADAYALSDTKNRAQVFVYVLHAGREALARYRKNPTQQNYDAMLKVTGFWSAPPAERARVAQAIDQGADDTALYTMAKRVTDNTQWRYGRAERGLTWSVPGKGGHLVAPIATFSKGVAQTMWLNGVKPLADVVGAVQRGEKRELTHGQWLQAQRALVHMGAWLAVSAVANSLLGWLRDKDRRDYGVGSMFYSPGGPSLGALQSVTRSAQLVFEREKNTDYVVTSALDELGRNFIPGYQPLNLVAQQTPGLGAERTAGGQRVVQDRYSVPMDVRRYVKRLLAGDDPGDMPADYRKWVVDDPVDVAQRFLFNGAWSVEKAELIDLYGAYLETPVGSRAEIEAADAVTAALRRYPVSTKRRDLPREVEWTEDLVPGIEDYVE